MKNKKILIISVLAILSLVLITIGATVAFFSYIGKGSTENTIESGSINFIYEEVNKMGNGISIIDALPVSDSEGKESNNYFDFKVKSSTGTTIAIPYEITARVSEGSDDLSDYVKVYLTKVNGTNEQQVALSIYSDLNDSTNTLAQQFNDKTLYKGEIPVGASDYTENYRLRMWLNNDSNDGSVLDYSPVYQCSNTTYTNQTDCESNNGVWNPTENYNYQNKTFSIKINVYANGEQASQQKIESASTTDISGLKINNISATENTDSTLNYDYYVTTSMNDANNIELLTLNNGQTYTVENITEQEATALKQVSTSQNLNLNLGINYLKVTVTSANRQNSRVYVVKVKVTAPISLDGLARMIYDANIVNDSGVDLTKTSQAANETGLYSMDVNNGFGGKDGITFFFRGNVTNNYVDFAGFTWRIVRINEDGTVRLIMQDGINNNAAVQYSSSYVNSYSQSSIKNTNNTWYANNIDVYIPNSNSIKYSDYVKSGEYFCQKAMLSDTQYDEPSASPVNLSCSDNLLDLSVGMITYDEVMLSGAYPSSMGNSYLVNGNRFWTMTLGWENYSVPWYVFNASFYSNPSQSDCLSSRPLRPVINLKANVTATGTGTSTDPYRIVYN